MKFRLYAALMTIVFAVGLRGVLVAQVNIPDTPQGKIVREYIDAFNSGDEEKIRQFFLDNVSGERLRDRPIDARVKGFKIFINDAKSLTLQKLLNTSPVSMSVVAKDGSGQMLTLTFDFDPTPERKFVGLRVEMGEQQPTSGPPMSRKEFLNSVKRYLIERVRDDKFSGVIFIARDTSVLLKKAYGDADKRFKIHNRTDTKFNLGSINKFFTRMAIGQLAEQGRLSFDKPIITYLPDYPNRAVAEKVTIDQLLSMKSGMGDFFGEKFENTSKDKIRTLKDYLQFFVNDTLLFEPGTQRRYSNAGFIVLGLVIEKLTGQDYYSYVRDHIFKPAGMNNTDWYASNAATPNLATGYTHSEGDEHVWISNIHALPGRGSSAGGGYTTLDDMHLFIRALLNGKLLSQKFSQWMVTNELPQTDQPLPIKHGGMGIAGGTSGVNSAVEFDAETGNILIVLANYDPPAAEEVAMKISGWMKRIK